MIEALPHVSLRMKHIFQRIGTHQIGRMLIAATEETGRDLLWVLQRYPMDITADAEALMRRLAAAFERRERQAEEIQLGNYTRQPCRTMALPPRDYQLQAAALANATGALLVADDLGLGKTATGITALVLEEGRFPALVVTLTHLVEQWRAEIERFVPGLRVFVPKVGTAHDLRAKVRQGRRKVHEGPLPDVVVLNYAKMHGWSEALAGWVQSAIFDEVQELRHPTSAKYAACRHIAGSVGMTVALSATPTYGYGEEWWSVMDCVRPGLLGTREEFLREWCTEIGDDKWKVKDPRALGSYLYGSGVAIRRRRADVRRELPPVQEVWHAIDCDATPLREVEASAMQLAHAILNAQGEDRKKLRQMSSDFVGALRQATGLAKALHVAAFVRMLVEQNGNVVLYGWHRSVYRVWESALGDLGIAWYTGSESGSAKHKEAQRFKSGEAKVLIMSLRSGAGLDGLQSVCNTVVIGELDWSPQVHAQAIGRLARDGQTDPVFAYFLWTDDGSDLTMRAVADDKHMQLVGVRDPLDSLVEEAEVDPDHVKRLAEAYLGRHKGAARS